MYFNKFKFTMELFFKLSKALRDFFEGIALLLSREDRTMPRRSQDVITSSLKRVCKNIIAGSFSRGIILLFSTGLLLLLVGAACIHTLLRFPTGLAVFSLGSLVILFVVFIKGLLLPLISLLNKERVALLIEQKYPSLNNALISSIQLSKDTLRKKTVRHSEQMVSMLIDDTANKLEHLDMNHVINERYRRASYTFLTVSVLIFCVTCVFNRSYFSKNIPLLLSCIGTGKGPEGTLAYSGPIIGDITIHYRYPLYSGLQPKTLYNTSGDMKAIKGSEVQINAISDRPLASAGIVFNDSTKIPFMVENEKIMKGVLPLLENGTYIFETTDSRGRTFRDTTLHTIQVETDQFPEVLVSAPAKDVTVNEKDTVELKYAAKDDFGISEISVVYDQENGKKTKTLITFNKKQLHYSGAYAWSLSELKLKPDDKIAYHVEVKDNDTISGPKVSSSKTYYLEIYSSRKKHMELVQLQERLLQEMLHMLSDDLTKRVDDERCATKDYLVMTQDVIQERAERIIHLFTDILVGMQEDTMANYSLYYSLENLKGEFRDIAEKKRVAVLQAVQGVTENRIPVSLLGELQKVQDEEVVEVEKIIIFLHEMIQKQKLDDALDMGKNLIQSQNNIEEMLNKLREGDHPELNERVLSELKRIEEAVRQMMEKLMNMAQGDHMGEFLNADALKKMEQDDVSKELNAMRDALNKGDLDAALQSAQKMLSVLQKMMDQMKSSAQNFADSSFADTLKNTDKLLDKITALESKERTLSEDTDQLKKQIQERISESVHETFQSFFEKQRKRLDGIKKDFSETKEILARNETLQEYLQVNRDLKRIVEEREAMESRLSEYPGSNEEAESFRMESNKLAELSKKYAELNREINRYPLQRDFLSISRDLPQTEDTLSHLEEMLGGMEAKESLDLAKELLNNVNQWNNRMKSSLEQGEVAKKEKMSKKDIDVAKNIDDAANQNQQIVRDLESMMQFFEKQQVASLTQEDQAALQKYAEKQKELQKEADDLAEMADNLSHQNPFMDETAKRQLDMASKSMGGATEKLEEQNVPGAVVDERESLYRIAEAKKSTGMAKERIEKGMMGGGMPMPFRGHMDEGPFGVSAEKVEIPSEEAYKAPKEFRQDILNALKEGLPEKYKDLNKDYYQRLVD